VWFALAPLLAAAQVTPHVAVIEVAPAIYAPISWESRAAVARAFYATHRDAYDFLVFFPAFPIEVRSPDGLDADGRHFGVRNEVSGIGSELSDGGSDFGSPSRLQGAIDIHSFVPGVASTMPERALRTLAHEVAHQWSARSYFIDPVNGARSSALLGPDKVHWNYTLSSDASIMFGSRWAAQADGSFVSTESMRRYSPLDLYLMGFLGPDEVPPFTLIQPAPGVVLPDNGLPPPDGTKLIGTGRTISIADVIAAEGARSPAVADAQKVFRAAFVILTPPGQAPTDEQRAFVDGLRRPAGRDRCPL
jgi:hypothetical protein